MGKLLDVGPGEITDRLTILSLKILFAQQVGKDCSHWLTERSKLLPQLRSRTLNSSWFEQTLELAAVNAALWHAEDDLRLLRQLPPEKRAQWAGSGSTWIEDVARIGLRLQELNDQRAALIAKINELAGEKSGGEKL